MTNVALVGLSGVGKSTILAGLARELPFLHLQASSILKAEIARRKGESLSSEALRLGDIGANQDMLVSGFHRAAQGSLGLIFLDGHVLIDGADGPTAISPTVFASMNIGKLAFLWAPPEEIVARRANDVARTRPILTAVDIDAQQRQALVVACEISMINRIPLLVFSGNEAAVFKHYAVE